MKNIISLGGNCSVAYQLRKFNINNISYPFDWCKLTIKNLIKVLENNFENYHNIKFKKIYKS